MIVKPRTVSSKNPSNSAFSPLKSAAIDSDSVEYEVLVEAKQVLVPTRGGANLKVAQLSMMQLGMIPTKCSARSPNAAAVG